MAPATDARTDTPDAARRSAPEPNRDEMPGPADRLLTLLDEGRARYRMIGHAPEGRTGLASQLRGHPAEQAAKCIVVRVKITKKRSRYVLAVIPGDRRVDLERVRELTGGRDAHFADRQTAERLADTVSGTIMPFAFNDAMELLVDPTLLEQTDIFFNAAALDRSIALDSADYVRLARPRVVSIVQDDRVLADPAAERVA